MTGQSLLDRMELVNAELQLQSGEEDVTRGLVALNVAQDYFESVLASEPGAKGNTTSTVTSSASIETTSFPTGLLRLDSLWRLNSTTSRPEWEMVNIKATGAHYPSATWPMSLGFASSTTGKPDAYYTDGRNIYWSPLPDNTYTFRWYGLQAQSDITAVGTFAYDDIVSFPLAAFAARLMKIGLDDEQTDLAQLAENAFRPVVKALSNFNRDGAAPLQYRYMHET